MRAPDFWHRSGSLLSLALEPAALAYAAAGTMCRAFTRPYRAQVPVVCIGNLVAGGAGKTPVAIAAARFYAGKGMNVHLLTRGYGGSTTGPYRVDAKLDGAAKVGDEPLLLAARAPTWVARDRAAGARQAVADGAEIIVMDDGLQNPGLQKDLSLVVVDGAYGFGNGRMIPAGPLREPVAQGLARAHAVVLMGEDKVGVRAQVGVRIASHLPVLGARLAPAADAGLYRGERVAAFAGIGRPEKFYDTLRELGAQVVGTRDFPDHHRYRPEEIMGMLEYANSREALLITTAKDAVRLPPGALNMLHVLPVELVWDDAPAAEAVLSRVLPEDRRGA